MNKHCFINAFFLIFLLFVSCNKPGNKSHIKQVDTNNACLTVELDYNSNLVPYDSLFDDVFYVKLQTTEKNLIGEIDQILFTPERIIIVDLHVAKSITVYDKTGKFLNQISKFGQGPEEFTWLENVTLTFDKEMIVINDLAAGLLKYFTLDGKFVKSQKSPFKFCNFEFLTEDIIASDYYQGNIIDKKKPDYKPKFILTDLSGNVSYAKYRSFYKEEFTSITLFPIRKFEDKIFYNPSFTDSIFLITPESLIPYYHFKMKEAPPLTIDENMTTKKLGEHLDRYPGFRGDFFDLKNSIYIRFLERRSPYLRFSIYSKSKKKAFTNEDKFFNPFFYFCYIPVAKYNSEYLVYPAKSYQILSVKDNAYNLKNNLPEKKKVMLDKLYENLTEDDNPVLFFYRVNI